MGDYIMLPRAWLDNIPSALHRGIFLSMLERADEEGRLTISVRGFADEIGVSYQVVRTAIAKLSANAIINAIATQRLTQITICDYVNCATPPRKQQRKANAIATQPKQVKFTPPTYEEAQAYIDEKKFHWGNADLFIDFYQQKNWRLADGKLMCDWKAAMRNWEHRWLEKKKDGKLKTQPDPRRGTDVGNHTAADYGGAF